MPKVSVIIPVHNAKKYLGECLDSILGQTLKDIEVLCVDDGSTDGSARLLEEYAAKDSRLKLLASALESAGAARNRGLDESRGEYLFFCDADDRADGRMLEKLRDKASRTNADIAVAGFCYYDEGLRNDYRRVAIAREFLDVPQPFSPALAGDRLFSAFRIQLWNKIFKRSFIQRIGLRFQTLPRVNDLAFVNTALALAGGIAAEKGAYYHYRKNHGGSLCSKIDQMPEMSVLAWLKVKENLESAGVFGKFRPAFAYAASHSLYEVVVSMQDASAMEKFFRKAQAEFIPALGLERRLAAEVAYPFFDSDSPLPILVSSLAAARQRCNKLQARFFALRAHPFRSLFRALWRRFA